MDNEIQGARSGAFPFDQGTVEAARDKLAPPGIAKVKDLYGGVTVGSSHPTGDFETTVDNRPPIKLDDKPTPSDENPPSVEEALAAKLAADVTTPKSYSADKMYQIRLNKRVEFEKDMWLSPHELHTVSGAFASKHKADIDAATEVAE